MWDEITYPFINFNGVTSTPSHYRTSDILNWPIYSSICLFWLMCPAITKHNKHVIIASKHLLTSIITCLLCFVFAGVSVYSVCLISPGVALISTPLVPDVWYLVSFSLQTLELVIYDIWICILIWFGCWWFILAMLSLHHVSLAFEAFVTFWFKQIFLLI